MKILTFGEVLWDLFDTERKIGGAPLNFSAHLAKLGATVSFVSAVGNDSLGQVTLEEVKRMNIATDHIAVLNDRETGFCKVTLTDGHPSYNLARHVAYDYIPYPDIAADSWDAFYFGTLASRLPESRKTRDLLLSSVKAKEVFFDINIRGNDWSYDDLISVLPYVTILKMSREEMHVFGSDRETEISKKLFEDYTNLNLIIITLDKDGAVVFQRNKTYTSEKPKSKVLSTVGAGDSFSACFLYNYLKKYPISVCLERAILLSDYVVTQLGAVPDYPKQLYDSLTE